MLWVPPASIAGEDLYWGSGGRGDAPHGDMQFLREDLNGSTAKYEVRDRQGEKWTLKLDQEAQPETVASRLVWAMGYGTREDYVVPDMRIEGLPAHLQRGRKMILPGGEVRNVRLERLPAGEKRVGRWQWRQNPFEDTRAFNGLRVMMALINNWDLMDYNTSIYQEKDGGPLQYVVSDLGASFGTTGQRLSASISKGNATNYARSRFVNKVTSRYVDFNMPTMPSLPLLVVFPREFVQRLHLRWIGKRVPRADAAWMGGLLAQVTDAQVRDAFRSANYSDAEVAQYTTALEARIGELRRVSGAAVTH